MKDPKDTLDVIFTVDVENGHGNIPFKIEGDFLNFGIKENCGINYIMDTFSSYDAKAVFFVNIYEHELYEPEYMPSLLRRIAQRGHEVALHAHRPPHRHLPFYVKELEDCSLEEQKQILEYGRDYIFQATGKLPISFRAGAYSANDLIFEALHETGFRIDSSVYYMQIRNKFKKYANKKNQIFRANGIIEFPVIVVWDGTGWKKLDINRLTEDDFIRAFEAMRKSSMYHTVQCMFHSFSFFKRPRPGLGGSYEEANYQKKKLEMILKFLRSSDKYRILTFEEYLNEDIREPDDLEDDVLYLSNRDLAYKYSDIEVLYDENVLTLINHFQGDGIQYAWRVYPVKGEGEGSRYESIYQFNNTLRIDLNEEANGKYAIHSFMKKDGKITAIAFYSAMVSNGKVLSIDRRFNA